MFFAKIVNSHYTKNRLQEYVSQQVKPLECLAVDDPESFKQHLEALVQRANVKFPRCRPLAAYLHKGYASGNSDLRAGVGEVVDFMLYQQRGVFEGGLTPMAATSSECQQVSMFA